MVDASEIIQQLNEVSSVNPLGYPYFGGPDFPVDVRLSAYRDDTNWALVIETLVFQEGGPNGGPTGHRCNSTFIYCYGDGLPEAPGLSRPHLRLTSDGPSGPLFDPEDLLGHRIRQDATDMRVRDKVVPVTTDRKVYEAAGVLIKWPTPSEWVRKQAGWKEHTGIHGCELLRLIVPKYRALFFATESEIVKRIGKKMPLLLRLDEWYHADHDNHEEPYQSESYQMIANVIAANEAAFYKPTRPPNTHWRNWPQAGLT